MTNRGACIAAFAALSFFHSPSLVDGHGYCRSPRARNYYANDIIGRIECTGSAGCPPAEYCPHCCNLNNGVCGKSPYNNYETATWLDKSGNPMPWRSQNGLASGYEENYVEGGAITIQSYLDTHHNGHMEARVCVVSGANSCTTPADFAGNELVFELDLALGGHPPMPKDSKYPERGMYAGGQGGSIKEFAFRYKLPMGIYGEKVLLQWKYITANSCSPPGYAAYFAANSNLPSSYWTSGLAACTPPYPNDGTRGTAWPEQFFNCAEITVLSGGPTIVPKPTPSPVTANPIVSNKPTPVPVVGGPPPCTVEWADCTYDWTNCCEGYTCTQIDSGGYGRCLKDTCPKTPTANPTSMPVTANPTTAKPTTAKPTSSNPTTPTTKPTSSNPTKKPSTAKPTSSKPITPTTKPTSSNPSTKPTSSKPTTARPVTSATLNPATAKPTSAKPTSGVVRTATTTRYWDCSGGACACAYIPTGLGEGAPAHCHSNAMFAAPANNIHGATFYGAAAISASLGGGDWMSSGCGKCWKVTGTSNVQGFSGVTTTLVLKGTNFCPNENPACGAGPHFDIAAPGFDVLQYSFAHVCPTREPEDAAGFAACGTWLINDSNVTNCDCSKFISPVLRRGCENFFGLKWDNPRVTYEEVTCPNELSVLHCSHPYAFEATMPATCANNDFSSTPTTTKPTSKPITSNPATRSPTSTGTLTTGKPTPTPISPSGTTCCGERNSGYQVCNASPWCNVDAVNCGVCGGLFTSVPLVRTGCCAWDSTQVCRSVDPTTNAGCQYRQTDCTGSCGGTWQPF